MTSRLLLVVPQVQAPLQAAQGPQATSDLHDKDAWMVVASQHLEDKKTLHTPSNDACLKNQAKREHINGRPVSCLSTRLSSSCSCSS